MNKRWTIQIICANAATTRQYIGELQRSGDLYRVVCHASAGVALENAAILQPAAVIIDESAIVDVVEMFSPEGLGNLESMVARLTEVAPVVIVAAGEREAELRFPIAAGAVDFVARRGSFVRAAAEFVERRIGLSALASGPVTRAEHEIAGDFGEILRHEVNNPLTGILGNAELLLSRRDGLPASAVARVETIAELAVRLREIVRRLSNSWGMRGHAGSASH